MGIFQVCLEEGSNLLWRDFGLSAAEVEAAHNIRGNLPVGLVSLEVNTGDMEGGNFILLENVL